jgi:hypothetical protein
MCNLCGNKDHNEDQGMPRRDFIKTVGVSMAGVSLGAGGILGNTEIVSTAAADKKIATIRGAFLYPPSNTLEAEGYYSWPGSDFDAEGRQKQYMSRIKEIERKLGLHIEMNQKPLDAVSDVDKFIAEIKSTNPEGLLLIPFKKLPSWDYIVRIVNETQIPTVILATLGILQGSMVRQLIDRPGVYVINSPDNFVAVESGLKMIKTRLWLRDALIVNIDGDKVSESTVPFIGTKVRKIPHQKFFDLFAQTKANDEVMALANKYMSKAVKIVHPTKEEIIDAAKNYFIFKNILAEEKGDALMMNCLPGLQKPHKHVPPCMGYMSLLDEGIAMGCESDLDGMLTHMLLLKLFDKPGFLHNSALDTENNHYWGAHCTAPSMMNGANGPEEPYELRSHCESGWGTVPRVLFKEGQEVTVTRYLSWPPVAISAPTIESRAARSLKAASQKPQLLLYSGKIIGCTPIPPAGGCRTNVEIAINELERATDLIGNHMLMMYGNHVKQLKQFCQLYDIEVVV